MYMYTFTYHTHDTGGRDLSKISKKTIELGLLLHTHQYKIPSCLTKMQKCKVCGGFSHTRPCGHSLTKFLICFDICSRNILNMLNRSEIWLNGDPLYSRVAIHELVNSNTVSTTKYNRVDYWQLNSSHHHHGHTPHIWFAISTVTVTAAFCHHKPPAWLLLIMKDNQI